MTNLKYTAVFLALLLAGCAQAPQKSSVVTPPVSPHPAPQADVDLKLPNVELTSDMLYQFLLADLAGQRGKQELASQVYIDLANSTRDPRVARRAAHLAFESRQMDKSIEAFGLWLELEPTSMRARQMLATLLTSGGKLEEARPLLADMLKAKSDEAAFVQTYSLLARHPDKTAVFNLMRELTEPYAQLGEAHGVLAQTATDADMNEVALKEIRLSRSLRPDWDMAALLESQLVQRESVQKSWDVLQDYLKTYPDGDEVRLTLARSLLNQQKLPEARQQFQMLLDKFPQNADMAFTVALISMQMGELDRAETELKKSLINGKKDGDAVYFYLGQLREAKQDEAGALEQYGKIVTGDYYFPARLRSIYFLSKGSKLDETRDFIHQTTPQTNKQRTQLLIIEAQLLREAKRIEEAEAVLLQGLEKLPNHPDLLYEAGMLSDMLGKHEQFEQMMRKVIQLKPDHAHAYNALGYSLIDRNERVDEAMQLVEKALTLLPNDAAIMDSVGWGHYRQNNLVKSVELLRRAYKASPDAEIAAHLGEVLWVSGDQDGAKKIWQDSLKAHPDDSSVQAAIKKFNP